MSEQPSNTMGSDGYLGMYIAVFVLVGIIGAGVGIGLGIATERNRFQKQAVRVGAAEWTADPETGDAVWRWVGRPDNE